MPYRTLHATGLLLTALVMGVFWGTWFTLTRSLDTFEAPAFLQIGHTIIANVAGPMRVLMPATLLVMLWCLWVYPVKRSSNYILLVIAVALMVVTLLITLLVEVPMDDMIRTWTVANIPADWTDHRAVWARFHTLRTFTSIASLAAFIWSWPRTARAVAR
ncbi:MAG TPA: anthrone oxygenase family protein [Flavobacteriales bacterium]|jgi:uncharacterized membrane protein|nr:anthrone oxygenase family protein [Flavobacteriales bacterium]